LAEVQSVTAAQPAQIGAKRVDMKGFFDVSYLKNKKLYTKCNFSQSISAENIKAHLQFLRSQCKSGTGVD